MRARLAEMRGRLTETRGRLTEMRGRLTEMRGRLTEMRAWITVCGTRGSRRARVSDTGARSPNRVDARSTMFADGATRASSLSRGFRHSAGSYCWCITTPDHGRDDQVGSSTACVHSTRYPYSLDRRLP